jgi:hypothetical protein
MDNPAHKRDVSYSADNGQPWEEDAKMGKALETEHSAAEREFVQPGEFIYGQTLNWYFKVMIWPMFILLLVEIGLRVMQTKYFYTTEPAIFEWLISLARIILFVYLAVSGLRQFKATKPQLLSAAIIGALFAGVILAVFQLFWYFKLWTIFNLLGQPLLMAAEALIVNWLIFELFKQFKR